MIKPNHDERTTAVLKAVAEWADTREKRCPACDDGNMYAACQCFELIEQMTEADEKLSAAMKLLRGEPTS